MDLKEEEKLVRAAQKIKSGPNLPFGELYKVFSPRVKKFFLKRLGDDELAQDLTSKVFEKALGGLDSFRWQGVPFSAWLFRISRNVFFDHLRAGRDKRKITIEEIPHLQGNFPTQFEELKQIQENELLEQALVQLPPREREIVYWKFYEGLTNRAIAEITKLSETNVGTILYRTLRKLREDLIRANA
ncbi:MAG: sigma-70 family RNA polymerase sigma factor [candidate division WWE3 bacterium]|nr:sigma-70 family RNA polymerase sigma factor [candidate division WWE3 bacterium]